MSVSRSIEWTLVCLSLIAEFARGRLGLGLQVSVSNLDQDPSRPRVQDLICMGITSLR